MFAYPDINTQGYGVRSGTKSILRFRGLGNTSSLRKLFFESLSVVFVAWVPCLRSRRIPCFIVLFSSGHRWLFFVALLWAYVVVASFLCLRVVGSSCTYLGRYLMYGDIYCTDFTFISYTFPFLLGTLLPCNLVTLLPCYSVTLLLCYLVTLLLCYLVTMLLRYSVNLLFCYLVTVLPYYSVTFLPCHSVSKYESQKKL